MFIFLSFALAEAQEPVFPGDYEMVMREPEEWYPVTQDAMRVFVTIGEAHPLSNCSRTLRPDYFVRRKLRKPLKVMPDRSRCASTDLIPDFRYKVAWNESDPRHFTLLLTYPFGTYNVTCAECSSWILSYEVDVLPDGAIAYPVLLDIRMWSPDGAS